jgi:hypothetical protein
MVVRNREAAGGAPPGPPRPSERVAERPVRSRPDQRSVAANGRLARVAHSLARGDGPRNFRSALNRDTLRARSAGAPALGKL